MRLRANLAYGTITDSPLAVGATTLNSAELPRLGNVVGSPDVMEVTLDPRRINGEPEIVHVTTYDGSAGSATILRGQEGTTAREHPAGTEWVHAETAQSARYSGALVYRAGSDQSVAAGTLVPVSFTGEEWDTDGYHDNAVNPSRLTVPSGGRYRIEGTIALSDTAATSDQQMALLVDGVIKRYFYRNSTATSGAQVRSGAQVALLSAGQYVEVGVFSAGAFKVRFGAEWTAIHIQRVD